MPEKVILELKNINKYYNNKEKLANDNISFKLYEGDIIGLIGESGCGKSTLAKIIFGIEKQDSGQLFFKDMELTIKNRKKFAKEIQMVFQNPVGALNPKINVIDLVLEPMLLVNTRKRIYLQEKAKEVLKYVNIGEEYYKRYPHQLSRRTMSKSCYCKSFICLSKFTNM